MSDHAMYDRALTDRAKSIRTLSPPLGWRAPTTESRLVKAVLIGTALLFLGLFLVIPLLVVFVEALGAGLPAFLKGLNDPDTIASIELTLLVAAISVPANIAFGIAAAWAIAKYEFRGKTIL